MSIATNLERQSLIAQRNNLEKEILDNSRAHRELLKKSSGDSLSSVNKKETQLDIENSSKSAQLASIDAELDSLKGAKLNYLA